MNWLLHALIIFALAIHVMPAGIHLNVGHNRLKAILATAIVSVIQLLMFGTGKLLGNTFLHLIGNWGKGVLFIVFALIALRMVKEAFSIRKGVINTNLENPKLMVLTGVSRSTDTFLTGMMFYYFPEINFQTSLIAVFFLSTFMMMSSVYTEEKRSSLVFTSLLYLIGAGIFAFSSIWFLFTL